MPEYLYTVDMGQDYGPRLEALAAHAGADDVEAFARTLMQLAIELREAQEWAERDEGDKRPRAPGDMTIDDDIPF